MRVVLVVVAKPSVELFEDGASVGETWEVHVWKSPDFLNREFRFCQSASNRGLIFHDVRDLVADGSMPTASVVVVVDVVTDGVVGFGSRGGRRRARAPS